LVRTTVWHVYECPPIDEWAGAASIEEHITMLGERGEEIGAIESFVLLFEAAVGAVAGPHHSLGIRTRPG
jgi:hypothetical protein